MSPAIFVGGGSQGCRCLRPDSVFSNTVSGVVAAAGNTGALEIVRVLLVQGCPRLPVQFSMGRARRCRRRWLASRNQRLLATGVYVLVVAPVINDQLLVPFGQLLVPLRRCHIQVIVDVILSGSDALAWSWISS